MDLEYQTPDGHNKGPSDTCRDYGETAGYEARYNFLAEKTGGAVRRFIVYLAKLSVSIFTALLAISVLVFLADRFFLGGQHLIACFAGGIIATVAFCIWRLITLKF
ncbi:MAG: hypothetical protein LBR98_06590 [Syntrophomonadaceae bacterium]|jgi:hypothetical protein|nr:hypothetical protein [Syntrophomonadaceae bacterium]